MELVVGFDKAKYGKFKNQFSVLSIDYKFRTLTAVGKLWHKICQWDLGSWLVHRKKGNHEISSNKKINRPEKVRKLQLEQLWGKIRKVAFLF